MTDHRIVMVSLCYSRGGYGMPPCPRCASDDTPHDVVARCGCATVPPLMIAGGIGDHIWTVTRRGGDLVWLSPSFDWKNDPRDPSKGSHVHEYVQGVRAVTLAQLHGLEP